MKEKTIGITIVILIGMIFAGAVLGNSMLQAKDNASTTIITDTNQIQEEVGGQYDVSASVNDTGSSPVSSENEVMNLVMTNATVQNWLYDHPLYQDSLYYDGYGQWLVEFIAENNSEMMNFEFNTTSSSGEQIDVLDVYVQDDPLEIVWIEMYSYSYSEDEWTPQHSEDEVMSLVTDFKIVKDSIEKNSYESYAWYYNGYWEVDFYSLDYWYYLSVIVDDVSFTILEAYGNTESSAFTLTASDALNIALQDPDVSHAIAGLNYTVDVMFYWYTFDMQGDSSVTWYVTFWNDTGEFYGFDANMNYDYWGSSILAFVCIDDATGEITYFQAYHDPVLNASEATAIATETPEIKSFMNTFNDTDVYAYYDGFTQVWTVYLQSPVFLEAYAEITVNDITGEVTNVFVSYPQQMPSLSIDEVKAIVTSLPEYKELQVYEPLDISIMYYNGEWSISVSSEVYIEAWLYVTINDSTQEITDLSLFLPDVPPIMSTDEVIAIALNISEVQSFLNDHPNASTYVMYYSGEWVVNFYDNASMTGYYVVIDDTSGAVIDQGYYAWYYYEGVMG